MLALPPAPAPARPRMLLVGTALASAAVAMLFVGMTAVYAGVRDSAGGTTSKWLPKGVVVPEIAANMMLIGMVAVSVMVQWAVYAMRQDDRRNARVALAVATVLALSVVNAQVFIYSQMKVAVDVQAYAVMFYSITGTFLAALISGLVMAAITTFRALGGRYTNRRHEGVTATALYWHTLTVVFAVIWYLIYVVK